MHRSDNNSKIFGLTSEEVEFRKIRGLKNTQDNYQKVSYLQIVIENALTIFNLINFIIISGLFYYYFKFNDDRLLLDSVGILIVIFINTFTSIFQKIKAVAALEKVELLKKHKVNVIREGQRFSVDLECIVQDEIIYLSRGEQIPVDCVVVQSQKFEVDESLITGESLSISKKEGDELLSGSFCVNGFAYVRAIRVGKESYSNQITHIANKFKIAASPLMNKINVIFTGSFVITLILVVLEGIRDLSIGEIGIEEVRRMSTIAFTIIPEGLIFFATVTFMIGIYRISQIGAIVQRINAIDSFSTVDIICLDKTGTITKNEIKLSELIPVSPYHSISQIKEYLGSFYQNSSNKNQTIESIAEFPNNTELTFLDEIPFDSELKYSAILFENHSQNTKELFILGAFDVLKSKIEINYRQIFEDKISQVDLFGKRNLLFCTVPIEKEILIVDEIDKLPLLPIAILTLKDTIREDFVDVFNSFHKMGKEFKVLTGDSIDATFTILKDAGIDVQINEIIDCRMLLERDTKELENIVLHNKFFARLTPSQKSNIVKILKSHHRKVCFIGDGINDLPAIKEADLGIAMDEGLTITKEVSDIVLQKNKFSLLPQIFGEGNKIINTVRYITNLYLVKNFTVLVMLLLNWFTQTPFALTPRKSSLLSALAVGLPSYFISFKNLNSERNEKFYSSVLVYVLSTSLLILFFTYMGYFSSIYVFGFSVSKSSNIMFSIFTLGAITNFFTLVAYEDIKNKKYYGFYAILMAGLFFAFSIIPAEFPPFDIISSFYEFEILNLLELMVVLIFSILLSFLLTSFHKYRNSLKQTK